MRPADNHQRMLKYTQITPELLYAYGSNLLYLMGRGGRGQEGVYDCVDLMGVCGGCG